MSYIFEWQSFHFNVFKITLQIQVEFTVIIIVIQKMCTFLDNSNLIHKYLNRVFA